MNAGDMEMVAEAARSTEAAEQRVLGMIGAPGGPGTGSPARMSAEELATMREVAANLRAACTRLWTMSGLSA